MQNPCFFIGNVAGSNNKGVGLINIDSGAKQISAWQNDKAVWANYEDYSAIINAIVSALNARYSLPYDGVFVVGESELSGGAIPPQHVIE